MQGQSPNALDSFFFAKAMPKTTLAWFWLESRIAGEGLHAGDAILSSPLILFSSFPLPFLRKGKEEKRLFPPNSERQTMLTRQQEAKLRQLGQQLLAANRVMYAGISRQTETAAQQQKTHSWLYSQPKGR